MTDIRETTHIGYKASKEEQRAEALAMLVETPPAQDTDVVFRFLTLPARGREHIYAAVRITRAEIEQLRQVGRIQVVAS